MAVNSASASTTKTSTIEPALDRTSPARLGALDCTYSCPCSTRFCTVLTSSCWVRWTGRGPCSRKSTIVSRPSENCRARESHWLVTEDTT